MSRRRSPPEVRRRTWTEGTVWDLLVAADALLYRFASPLADLGMTARERRHLRGEVELLKTTRLAFILSHVGSARRPLQPWLYVRTPGRGYYRLNDGGRIERYGRRIQRLGGTSITEHGWYPCSLRGVRWLQVVADGLVLRKVKQHDSQGTSASQWAKPPPAEPLAAEQLRLFPEL